MGLAVLRILVYSDLVGSIQLEFGIIGPQCDMQPLCYSELWQLWHRSSEKPESENDLV